MPEFKISLSWRHRITPSGILMCCITDSCWKSMCTTHITHSSGVRAWLWSRLGDTQLCRIRCLFVWRYIPAAGLHKPGAVSTECRYPRSPFLNLHGLSRVFKIPVMGFVGRKVKDLSLFKINLRDKSAEDRTVLFVSYLFQLWRNVARNVAAFFWFAVQQLCLV